MRRALPLHAFATALAVCPVAAWAQASADDPNTVKLLAAQALLHDSNLFRLSNLADPQRVLGRNSTAETIGITTLGLQLDKVYSLQRWELDLSVVDYRFSNFGNRNFTAKNHNASWRWAATPRLRGNLSTRGSQTLGNFADVQNPSANNTRRERNTRLDAQYELAGPWQLTAGLSRASTTSQQRQLGEDDTLTRNTELGLRHVFASGTVASYLFRRAQGDYLNRVLSPTALLDDSFSQRTHELGLQWAPSGKTTLNATVAALSRSHPNFAQRDFSGTAASLGLAWAASGKLRLNASYARELSSFQTGNTNYTQTDRITLGPAWQVGARTTLRASHSLAQRDYLGSQGALARADTTNDTTLALDWAPTTYLNVSASLQRARRSSTQLGLDYAANAANLSLQLSY